MSKIDRLIRFLKSHGVVAQLINEEFMVLKVEQKGNELIKMWQKIEPTWLNARQFIKGKG